MMQTPVEVEFQEIVVSPIVQELIEDHARKLEQRYTARGIAMKGPGHRHQTGGRYDIDIRLALPDGNEVKYPTDTEGRQAACRTVARRRWRGSPRQLT
jgi:hypothetical protein